MTSVRVPGGTATVKALCTLESATYREPRADADVFDAARFADPAVVRVAVLAVRPVVVAARFAVVATERADFFAVVAVLLAPVDAARILFLAPAFALRAVSTAPSAAADVARRMLFARVRATVDPVGDTFGLLPFVIRAMRS